jgi:hypothetical protein
MGNEEDGISHAMRAAADERFVLPMVGLAESFNLSVATAIITLAHLSAASSSSGCSSNNFTSGDNDNTIKKETVAAGRFVISRSPLITPPRPLLQRRSETRGGGPSQASWFG